MLEKINDIHTKQRLVLTHNEKGQPLKKCNMDITVQMKKH